MRWIIFTTFLTFASSIYAQPQDWMKQSDPDSLGLLVTVSERCPFTQDELRGTIEGEYLRARITPTRPRIIPTRRWHLNLNANVNCTSIGPNLGRGIGYAVDLNLRFSTYNDSDDFLYEYPSYGYLMSGSLDSNSYFLNVIRDQVAKALTDYLRANQE